MNQYPSQPGIIPEEMPGFYVGQFVAHALFGIGEIMSIEGTRATVSFDIGTKVLDLGSRRLVPLDSPDGFMYHSIRFRERPGEEELEVLSRGGRYVSEVVIPDKLACGEKSFPVTRIRERAFAYVTNLRSVRIPSSLKDIAPDAFEGSSGIAQVRHVSLGHEHVTLVQDASGLWGVIADPAKKVSAIPREYEQIRFYAAWLSRQQKMPVYYFLVQKGGLWGLLNKAGREQAPCIYDELTPQESADLLTGFRFRRGCVAGIVDGKGQENLD